MSDDELSQRGSVSLTLLLSALFLTAFGVGGQISTSIAASTALTSDSRVMVANANLKSSGSVLAKQVEVTQLSIPGGVVASESAAFLTEVTDIASPSAVPSPKAVQAPLMPPLTPKPKSTIRALSLTKPRPSTSPTMSPKPTGSPSGSPKQSSPTPSVKSKTPPPSGSLSGDVIFDLVNKHRVSIGKPALQKDPQICSIVQARASQVRDELYGGKKMHSGFYGLNLPYWATENISAYASEAQSVSWWLSDGIHKKAIESDAKYSCAACFGRYCSQVFTSFVKK